MIDRDSVNTTVYAGQRTQYLITQPKYQRVLKGTSDTLAIEVSVATH